MSSDSIEILSKLVRTGLWSKPGDISNFKKYVVDVDSLVTFLYRLCVSDHIKKLKKICPNSRLDLNSATLVNYTQYSGYVAKFFNHLRDQQVQELHLVYQGKFMEAPLFGLLAAQFKRNTQKVRDAVSIIDDNNKNKTNSIVDAPKHMSRPNLALNIFKLLVKEIRKQKSASGISLHIYQAFYSAYPLMTKLARDLRCPVITNNGDFILMDVRAGFLFIDEIWSTYIADGPNFSQSSKGQSSKLKSTSVSSIKIHANKRSSSTSGVGNLSFHHNILFIRQHPGLTNQLSVRLYPLTTIDFVVTHSKSLKHLGVYDANYKDEDFITKGYKIMASSESAKNELDKRAFRRHHKAAERLELALRFCCCKNVSLLGNLFRSEALRTSSSIDDDFLFILQNYMVAFRFKERLRFVLKNLSDPQGLNFIESLLTSRESTADFLLDILATSIGHLASVNYNRFIQFEDLGTKNSPHSLLSVVKSAMMSLFGDNKTHRSEHSKSLSNKQPDTATRYANAQLTIVDREGKELVERTIDTTRGNDKLGALRGKLHLSHLANNSVSSKCRVQFINQVFHSTDMTKVGGKVGNATLEIISNEKLRVELAIVLSLFRFAYSTAQQGDSYFKKTYSSLAHMFEVAIFNHFRYLSETRTTTKSSEKKDNKHKKLVDLIGKHDFVNIAAAAKSADSPKLIRHLIELLGASIEGFIELNSYLNYPLPELELHKNYNPILLYNLTLYLYQHPDNKILVTF